MTAPENPAAPAIVRAGRGDWVLVVLVTLLAGVVAVFGVLFLPLYVGAVPVPVVVVFVVLALIELPRLSHALTRTMVAALAPVVAWLIVTVGLYLAPNTLYLGLPVAWRGWQFALLVGAGAIAAAGSVGMLWSEQLRLEWESRPRPGSSAR